jgi:acyl-coenzyme A synthetase/AMP-(fatty) acid ligase
MNASIDAVPRDYNFAADILKRNLDAGRGDKTAYIDHRGSITYAALAARADCFGRVLHARGIQRDERILLCLLDTVDWPTAFLGAIKFGAVPVPVNTLMTEDDYRYMLHDSRARMLVVSAELLPKFKNLIGACPDLDHVIVSGDGAFGYRRLDKLLTAEAEAVALEAANATRLGLPTRERIAPTKRDDMCFWLYTSGSTGRPKGAVHTHADLKLTDDLYAGPILGITEDDVCY